MTTKPLIPRFIPSSACLDAMIARAMVKCDGDCEQAALREEARAEARMARSMAAEAAQRRLRFWDAA